MSKFSLFSDINSSKQTDYLAEYLPDDKTFEAKAIVGTNLRITLEVFGIKLKQFLEFQNLFTNEMGPDCANYLIEEWERMVGIPDDCFTGKESLIDRRRNIIVKLGQMNVQTANDFKSLAEFFGVTAEVVSGIDSGITFGGGDAEARFTIVITFILDVEGPTFPYTFPILFGTDVEGLLTCIFNKVKPANVNVLFIKELNEVFGDIYWKMDELSGDVFDSTSNPAFTLEVNAASSVYASPSLRKDNTGTSIRVIGTSGTWMGRDFLALPYEDGLTIEYMITPHKKADSGTPSRRPAGAMQSAATFVKWSLQWDNYEDISESNLDLTPVFAIRAGNLAYIDETDVPPASLDAYIRGTVPVIIDNTYHVMITFRPSTNDCQLWINGVSIGISSLGSFLTAGKLDGSLGTSIRMGDYSIIGSKPPDDSFDELKIHFLEADQAFATSQASFANFT